MAVGQRAAAGGVATGWGFGAPVLERGGVHEWFGVACPAVILAGLAGRAGRDGAGGSVGGGAVVWIGRACWAHPAWLGGAAVERSVFVDPPGDAERLWAIDQALRTRGVACVIADARRLDMAGSRRLQLAAEAGGALGLLVRPPDEERALSAARTRWRVGPAPNPDARWFPEPRWTVELLRCKGLRPATDARRWVVQLNHDTGDVTLVPDAADRGVPAPAAWRSA